MLEFALVLPLFATALLGIFEFGRAFMVYQVLVNSSRAAVRKAVIANASTTDVEAAAKEQVQISGLNSSNFNVSYKVNGTTVSSLSSVNRGDAVSVRVAIPFQQVAVLSPLFLNGVTLNGETVMRAE
jgi:Flp pilus assembly protein TadG